jgi:hypothetical protein
MSGVLRSGDAEAEATAPGDPHEPHRSSRRRGIGRRSRLGRPLRVVGGWLLAGVVVGVLWRVLTPTAVGWAESYEADYAGDVVLAGLGVTAGLLTAALGQLRPGPGPGSAQRFVVAVLGAAAASGLAWSVGGLTGAPRLVMPAVLLLWPLAIALATVLWTLVATLVLRDPYDDHDSRN